ncbi:chemotaxis protein MotB [Rhodobacter sp. Har01]|uniref:flagellar motor protein MotB n=1 Tax=Rhodobacter sp. Har01 TaxID=2883999 RepID=UPI001D06A61E|nr:flagellar motor protein MotB [Rhodobacter sp. Har01]MCB6177988.1 chemotaxis protein MotB [Rhodobacter sp. Har01]
MTGLGNNAAPVIIKRKKVIKGGGHHGGAWKVAYADFVTAMMAFFLLMWLLNATTEKQRKGLSDYFNPTIPINRVSGGGDGALGGDTLFSEDTKVRNGSGGTSNNNGSSSGSAEDTLSEEHEAEQLKAVQEALFDRGGESRTMETLLKHVITRVTDEGLVIEIFDVEGVPLFAEDSDTPAAVTVALADLLVEVLNLTANKVAVNGHVRTYPVTLADNPAWDLSAARAQKMRELLEMAGLTGARLNRIGGFADRKPAVADAAAIRNNRIEIILLRADR